MATTGSAEALEKDWQDLRPIRGTWVSWLKGTWVTWFDHVEMHGTA